MKAIISADWHLRADLPRCRIDEDWIQTQKNILRFISLEANSKTCPVFIVGDIFHQANVPAKIVSMFIDFVNQVHEGVFILAGNHDLQHHNIDNLDNSSFSILDTIIKDGDSNLWYLSEFGSAPNFGEKIVADNEFLFLHELIFPSRKDIPKMIEARCAADLLKEYKKPRWIFTGDYHHEFIVEQAERFVVNPGCITRQTADMKDYKPTIIYVDTEEGYFNEIDLPDTERMVDDSYLREEEEREGRIEAFVDSIRDSKNVSLDYSENVKIAIVKNKDLSKDTISAIHNFMEW